MSKHPHKAPQRVEDKPDEPKNFAVDLIGHSFWAAVTFIVLLVIAGGIELFAHLLMKLINADRFLTWVARSAAGALAIIDFVFMIAVVIKKARTYVKEV